MRKHRDPYRIQDESNLFEVTENSSHPDLKTNTKRVWHFKGYTFHTATELQRFFLNEGLNPKRYWFKPVVTADGFKGGDIIHMYICERIPQEEKSHPHFSYEEIFEKRAR